MRRYSIAIVVLPCIVACASDETVAIDLPKPIDMHTMLVGIEYEDSFRAHVVDLDQPFDESSLPHIPKFTGDARLFAMFYKRTTADLELQTGELAHVLGGVPLADFDEAMTRAVRDGTLTQTWDSITKDGSAFNIRVKEAPIDRSYCPTFTSTVHQLDTTERFFAAAAMSDSEVLAFGFLGTVYRITPDEPPERITPTVTSTGIRSAAAAPNGDVWLGDTQGRILRGHPERGYEVVFDHDTDIIQWMDGPRQPSAADEELFVLTNGGEVLHLLNGQWQLIVDYQTKASENILYGGVTWIEPEVAVAVPAESITVATLENGRYNDTITMHTSFGGLAASTRTRAGRVPLMTGNGTVLELIDNVIVKSIDHVWPRRVSRMSEHGANGFLYVRYDLHPVYAELGRVQCDGERPGLPEYEALQIVSMGTNRSVVLGTRRTDSDLGPLKAQVMIVETTPP